jgi:nitrite reductase (NADH) small subunit
VPAPRPPGPFSQDYSPVAEPGDGNWHRAGTKWEVPRGGRKLVTVGGVEIGIFLVGGKLSAYRNACPHAGAPVCAGLITGTTLPGEVYQFAWGRRGEILRCPWHGWEFDLANAGRHLAPTDVKLKSYPLRVETDGSLWVKLP